MNIIMTHKKCGCVDSTIINIKEDGNAEYFCHFCQEDWEEKSEKENKEINFYK